MNDICKHCNGTGVYRPRKNSYNCKYCNGTGKRAEFVASKEKRGGERPRSILDLKRPGDVLSIEYDEDASEPPFLYILINGIADNINVK